MLVNSDSQNECNASSGQCGKKPISLFWGVVSGEGFTWHLKEMYQDIKSKAVVGKVGKKQKSMSDRKKAPSMRVT